ncbi:hypothetical protein LA080_013411 [Diaporthe eres]|nr:hypothetical protein LA080_013411 [Diaporthe eres]
MWQQDRNDGIKRLATELFERAHLEDRGEALRAELRRNEFLFEAGDWFAGLINGLRKFRKIMKPTAMMRSH